MARSHPVTPRPTRRGELGAVVRIVYLIDNLGHGGAQRQVVEIALHLRRHFGDEVEVVIYRAIDFFAERLRAGGVPVTLLAKRHKLDPRLPLRIRRLLLERPAEIVHAILLIPAAWGLAGVRALPARRRPAYLAAERSALITTGPVDALMQRLVYRSCDAVTANSAPAHRLIRERLGVPAERAHYIPNGIDLEAWDRAAARPAPFALEAGRFHLALVGRYERPEKNHALLLEALERLGPERVADWRVWLVGAETGGERFVAGVRDALRRRGLAEVVRLLPPTHELPALLARVDALVLPSRYEGFPNVVLEAMASARPVLAAPVGDVPSMIRDGETGLLVSETSAAGLAAGLLRLAALGAQERAALGRRARASVESRYRMADVAERYRALYAELLARRAPG